MSLIDYEKLLHDYIAAVWKIKNPAALDQFLAPDYLRHRSPNQEPLTRAGQKQLIIAFQAAFPDASLTVEEVITVHGRIAFRSTLRATHQGQIFGIAASGRAITVSLLDLIHIKNNQFVEQWGGPDLLDLVTQLGGKITS